MESEWEKEKKNLELKLEPYVSWGEVELPIGEWDDDEEEEVGEKKAEGRL